MVPDRKLSNSCSFNDCCWMCHKCLNFPPIYRKLPRIVAAFKLCPLYSLRNHWFLINLPKEWWLKIDPGHFSIIFYCWSQICMCNSYSRLQNQNQNLTVTKKEKHLTFSIGISISETRFSAIVLVISKLIYFLPRFSVWMATEHHFARARSKLFFFHPPYQITFAKKILAVMLNKCSYKTQEKLTDFLPTMPIEKTLK